MVISFFGHSSFCQGDKYKESLLLLLNEIISDKPVELYPGGYGGFDRFAYACCKEYQKLNRSASLVYVTPYPDGERLKSSQGYYDTSVYPPIEEKLKKYAITYRNQYMIERSDAVIFYVKREYGGAYEAYKYARRKKKEIYNIENFSKIT